MCLSALSTFFHFEYWNTLLCPYPFCRSCYLLLVHHTITSLQVIGALATRCYDGSDNLEASQPQERFLVIKTEVERSD